MQFYAGVDIGGTFTDGVVIDSEGRPNLFKTPTTPEDPSRGFLNLLKQAAEFFGLSLGEFLGSVVKLTYGTTLATNLLIEGRVAKTGVLTTGGFRDTLPIARIGREYLDLDLQFDRPPSLVPRHLIAEVEERVDWSGKVLTPLRRESVEDSLSRLLEQGIEALAICLLWSFKNPTHERLVAEVAREKYPHLYLSLSSEVAPVLGEYERSATTAMNAMLGPPVRRHLSDLSSQLRAEGLRVPLLLMQSNGGVVPAEDAAQKPVQLISSGPAGGVIASQYLGEVYGYPNLLCVDMGGTSFDVSLITGRQYSSSLVSRAYGQSVYVPMIDVYSIGAGGGSIAWLDLGRRLKVGPQSAGSKPGPVCYGWGGAEPTVTDADALLGYLNPRFLMGGRLKLDREAARAALEEKLANPLGMSVEAAAAGIVEIVEAHMADAMRVITIEKGYDPRDYVLVAYGGAGPLHAASLARELGIKKTIVPFFAGVQSAYGIVSSDIVHSYYRSIYMPQLDARQLAASFEEMEEEGREVLRREGISPDKMRLRRSVDMRYRGQVHEVPVPVPEGPIHEELLAEVVSRFELKYQELYGKGSAYRQLGCEIVNLRLDAVGEMLKPRPSGSVEARDITPEPWAWREVYDRKERRFLKTPIFESSSLPSGSLVQGPAVVEYAGSTAVILKGQVGRIDPQRNLMIEELA